MKCKTNMFDTKTEETPAVIRARGYLPDAKTYMKDYFAVWLHGTCYYFRWNDKKEWIYYK